MASISRALERIKQDPDRYVPQAQIVQACRQIGHTWRKRQFDPVHTLYCFPLQMLMLEAARRQQVACGRISFIDALRWLRQADPGEALPKLVVNPLRPGRCQPRVIKDRNDSYPRMTRPRSFLKKHPGYYGK